MRRFEEETILGGAPAPNKSEWRYYSQKDFGMESESSFSEGESGGLSSGPASEEEEISAENSSLEGQGIENRNFESEKGFFLSYERAALAKRQAEVLQRAEEVLCLPRSVCRALLRAFNWRLDETLAASISKPDICCKILKVECLDQVCSSGFLVGDTEDTCMICFDDAILQCLDSCKDQGHWFCQDCWSDYADSLLANQTLLMRCMSGDDCVASFIEDKAIAQILGVRRKVFVSQLVDSFVCSNQSIVFCPYGGCQGVVEIVHESLRANESVECSLCEKEFCFRCRETPHEPASCADKRTFMAHLKNGNASEDLLKSVAQVCPGCGALGSKVSGCHHITCACGFHYCYLCRLKFGSGPKGGSDGYGSHVCPP